jgi:tRNA(fMet)-specific endonuclease VapC
MAYLLDTNVVIGLLDGTSPELSRRVRQEKPSEIALSAIVMHELVYGAFRSHRTNQNLAIVEALLFPVLEFDKEDARHAGEIRALLASGGTPIGPYDALIAGQAVSRNLVLVSHNEAEFRRVPGLRFEDWEA